MERERSNVLVLGANGFVGSRFCEVLARKPDSYGILPLVHTMGRAARIGRLGLTLYLGDAKDPDIMEDLVKRSDIIVNLIAGSDAITKGTLLTARLARKHHVKRYVHVSSAAVYGIVAHEGCVTEDAPLRRTGIGYCDAKIDAEEILRQEARRGLSVVMLRPRVIWGPYSSWVLPFFREVLSDPQFMLIDEGKGACNSIFTDNLVDAIIWAMSADVPSGEAFFVKDRQDLTWAQFYAELASTLPFAVRFTTISAEDLRRMHDRSARGRPAVGFGRRLVGLARSGLVPLKQIPPVKKMFLDMPEAQKIKMKRMLGMSWPEREIRPLAPAPGRNLPDLARLLREQGRGFTRIDKIQAAGWQPPLTVAEGLSRSASWLRATRLIPTGQQPPAAGW